MSPTARLQVRTGTTISVGASPPGRHRHEQTLSKADRRIGVSEHPVMVTGAAGFIGFHVARALLDAGAAVVGVDNLNDYYDPALKEARLARARRPARLHLPRLDLADRDGTAALFAGSRPKRVIHLAAQAGVRYSLDNPHAYVDANLVGFLNVLEGCRHNVRRAPRLRLVELGLRRQHEDAVLGARQRRPSA